MISCQALYESVRDYVGLGTGDERLSRAFISSVNRALQELNLVGGTEAGHSYISSTEDTITTLESKHEWILFSGVVYNMTRFGHRPSDPKLAQIVYADSKSEWERAKGEYVEDIWTDVQDDEDNDIIALGSVV